MADPATAPLASAVPQSLRRHNVSAILRAILSDGPLARTEIGQLTGLSAGAVTRLTQPMLATGLLVDLPARAGPGGGRPLVPLDLDRGTRVVAGLHIGLEYTRAALVDLRGSIIEEHTVEHESTHPDAVLAEAADLLSRLIAGAGSRTVLAASASIGGVVDHDRGIVVEHLPLGWHGVPVRNRLSERLGRPVLVDNTVRAIALAEAWFGDATRAGSLVHLFVGNVVGAAVVTRHELYRGFRSAAGRLTHVQVDGTASDLCECGSEHCFEVVASGFGVLAYGREHGIVGPGDDLDTVIAHARGGDHAADALLRRRARHVGEVCALLFDVIDPDVITLSGWYAQGPEYVDVTRETVRQRDLVTGSTTGDTSDRANRVRATSLGVQQLLVASASLALTAYYTDPLAYEPELAAAVTP